LIKLAYINPFTDRTYMVKGPEKY